MSRNAEAEGHGAYAPFTPAGKQPGLGTSEGAGYWGDPVFSPKCLQFYDFGTVYKMTPLYISFSFDLSQKHIGTNYGSPKTTVAILDFLRKIVFALCQPKCILR